MIPHNQSESKSMRWDKSMEKIPEYQGNLWKLLGVAQCQAVAARNLSVL